MTHRKVKMSVSQSCPALCGLMYWSPPGSSVHGILQARILNFVAIPFSKILSWPKDRTSTNIRSTTPVSSWSRSNNMISTGVGCHWLLRVTWFSKWQNNTLLSKFCCQALVLRQWINFFHNLSFPLSLSSHATPCSSVCDIKLNHAQLILSIIFNVWQKHGFHTVSLYI